MTRPIKSRVRAPVFMANMIDLLAGMVHSAAMAGRDGTILVFDSGLGGLTVLAEVKRALPGSPIIYCADDAAFPYGALDDETLTARVVAVVGDLVARHQPDLVVIACNTASTLALPALRAAFPIPVVGTVPAVKPAVASSRSGRVAILATPGTVKRDYTRALIDTYAGDVTVDLVGATGLASLAERALRGEVVDDRAVLAEIAPCFVDRDGRRTDVVALACTHYPLLLSTYERLAPWPVTFIDPAPAIARRAASLLGPLDRGQDRAGMMDGLAVFTRAQTPSAALVAALARHGLGTVDIRPMPLWKH